MGLSSIALRWMTVLLLFRQSAAEPRVNLGYATYEGTALENGIDQFLGMRYAAPPLCENRFRHAKEPQAEIGIIQAKEHGPICYGVQGLAFGSVPLPLSEDCLFIDVYVPSNLSDSDRKGLPVMLWLQGGAFVQLFNPNYNGSGLIEASGRKVIVATFNYRVGPYGFLASKELAKEGNLNLGLLDQRAAIRWVQNHIAKFGGDPTKITLFGTSVGGGSVLLQTLAYGGNPPEEDNIEWVAGIAEAAYIPPLRGIEDLEYQYYQLLDATNCADLACLRTLNSTEIQAANIAGTAPGQTALPLFPYGPVIDGKFFTDTPYAMLRAGNFSKHRPLVMGSSHTEGTIFTPQANTTDEVDEFMKTQYPDLTDSNLAEANALYSSVPQTFPGVTIAESPLYYRTAMMYGDTGYACPTLNFASELAAAGVKIYLFRDNIVDPVELAAGFIVPHTWEVQAVWGPEYATSYVALPGATSYEAGGSNHKIVSQMQKYWTDFALTSGHLPVNEDSGSPKWETYGCGRRLRLQTNATAMEAVQAYEQARCSFWKDMSANTHI